MGNIEEKALPIRPKYPTTKEKEPKRVNSK